MERKIHTRAQGHGSVANLKRHLLRVLFFAGFFLFACQTINRSRTEAGVPPLVVIFSFDDGPNAQGEVTARLLDVLKEYDIRALFALWGENAEKYPELVKRIDNEAHQIVNHGYSDRFAVRMDEDAFRENLMRGEVAIFAALGKKLKPKLYRPHGGFYNRRQEKICREAGYTIVPVNVRLYDAVLDGTERSKVVKEAIEKIEKEGGGIILLHDGRGSHVRMKEELEKNPGGAFDRSWIPGAVEEMIVELLGRGFKLDGFSDYMENALSE
jgi:peptidoglycan/xylan/chitin deacetylase (PgdA/CDA1 family)